jgi:hypothetical protein
MKTKITAPSDSYVKHVAQAKEAGIPPLSNARFAELKSAAPRLSKMSDQELQAQIEKIEASRPR